MKYIVRLQDRVDRHHVGGKAYPLAQLLQRGFFVPHGFVLTPAAFDASLTRHQRETLRDWQRQDTVEVRELQNLLATLHLGEVVQSEIFQILVELFPYGGQFAVRSSAIEEDQQEYSLAGQLKTFLTVTPENLGQKITQVWQSAYRETVMLYRQRQGLQPLPKPPAVLVQQMLNPSVSGVAFGADPVTGRRNVRLISAVYGLGTTLVSGEQDADTFYLDSRDTIIQRQMAHKGQVAYPNPLSESGVSIQTIEGDRAQQSTLTDAQIIEIGQLVRRASQELASPQDIEWAIAETGQLYLLQSRPITALPSTPEPTGLYQIWDNSNIAESYSGVTTPLTFTFARRAYTEVYRQFCRLMGISDRTIERRDRVFSNMIGLMRGRIYYNLLNWYQVLAMLPGFRLNRQFMEQMMGVKEPLPEVIVADIAAKSRWQDGWDLGRSLFSLLFNYLVLPLKIWRFKSRLRHVLEHEKQELSYLRVDQLVDYYSHIERALLPHWQAPIVNDFFAMISYGILCKVTTAWCDDHNGALANTLVQQPGAMISAEPARQIQIMAQLIHSNSALVDTFCTGEVSEITAILKHHPELATRYQVYLEQFSDRCLDELKLESPTLNDNPLPLLRTIGLVARGKTPPSPQNSAPSLPFKRQFRRLGWRRFLLSWLVSSTQKRLRDRENLRFERTRVFGLARQIFLELGRRFFALDAIQQIQDIFYLEVAEIIRFVEGTSTCTDLKSLVALRRAEFDRYRQTDTPRDRHCTYGIPYLYRDSSATQPARVQNENQCQGQGCSPGIVRGVVTVIHNPQAALAQSNRIPPGAIVVAERTDPGWILLFAAAAGLIVERGSLLSHAAIVSRELGLPAIVSAPGVMAWLQEGDWIEMDGSTGQITKITRSH